MRLVTGLVTGLVILAAACGQGEVLVGDSPQAALSGTRWVVVSFDLDGVRHEVPAGAGITVDFDSAGRVGGSSGCNLYFGEVAYTAQGLSISGLGGTEMACEPDRMEREAAFLEALSRIGRHSLSGDGLTLSSPDARVSILMTRFVPAPDRTLSGTDWVLETLISGEVASSIIAGTAPTLSIDEGAGTITGNTGCNDFGGSVTVEGGALSVGDLTHTEMACTGEGVMDQEANVLEVLAGAVSWEIDGTILRITAEDGRALEYRASA